MKDPTLNEHGMTELLLAAYHGELDWVRNCIQGGLDIQARDKGGMTPLHWVADMGMAGPSSEREEIVKLLIESGADVQAVDNAGRSVLFIAVLAGNREIVRLLIGANADVNRADNRGCRPLSLAMTGEEFEMTKILEAAGASD